MPAEIAAVNVDDAKVATHGNMERLESEPTKPAKTDITFTTSARDSGNACHKTAKVTLQMNETIIANNVALKGGTFVEHLSDKGR